MKTRSRARRPETSISSPKNPPQQAYFNVTWASAHANVSPDTIYTAIERRELECSRIGGQRIIRLRPEWIDRWMNRHTQGCVISKGGRDGAL